MLSWRFWAVMITSSSATLRVSSTWARVGVAASTATATRLRRKSRLAVGSLSCEYTMFSPTCNEMDARPHLHGVLLLWIPCPGCPAVVDIPPLSKGGNCGCMATWSAQPVVAMAAARLIHFKGFHQVLSHCRQPRAGVCSLEG